MQEDQSVEQRPGGGVRGMCRVLWGLIVDPREEVTLTPLAEEESSSKRDVEERFVGNMSLSGLPQQNCIDF